MSTVSSASSNASAGTNGVSRVLVPLIFGHTSERLSRPTASGHTHRWTVYVRAPGPIQFQDRSFIKKVVFNLHESFDNPIRVVKDPPFEVTETGYGGFTMPIKLQFNGVEKIYCINYELILSLEKFSETNIEQIIELRNPSKELAVLVQKYCPKKKDATKEKTMVFSKSSFPLTKPLKASVSIGKNGHEMNKASSKTETKAPEESVGNKEREKAHSVLERKDTDFFASAVAPSVPPRPSSKASDSSAPESLKSTNEKTRKIINCLFSEHDSASEESKVKKSKKSDKSKEEGKKKKKKELDDDSVKRKLSEKSGHKLIDVGESLKSEKNSKHEGDRTEKTSKPFQKSDFIFKEKSEKILKSKPDESEKSEGKKSSKKIRKMDDDSSKESNKALEKLVPNEKLSAESLKSSEKYETEFKEAKLESKSSELKEPKEKVKEKKPKKKLFAVESSKPEERPSISIKLQKPSEDAMDVSEPEPSVSCRQEDTSESIKREKRHSNDKNNVELAEGKQSPIEVKRKYIDIKTEPNSPCRFASDWHKRPHSSISLVPPPYNSSPMFFEPSNYATTPSSVPTTPRIPSSSLSNEEDDSSSRHDEESGGGSVVEKNWSIDSESPSFKYEYRLQQLMEQLHSIQDPDLLYRCADTLIEYDATAVTIDEYGQMDFDLYHVKKETVALLEEIFASLTPMSR